jgi:hypothetical protein
MRVWTWLGGLWLLALVGSVFVGMLTDGSDILALRPSSACCSRCR